ncbi:MAG TPA: dockerin type I repeat-containing protein [Candidatus Glassbacteria bacterium]|nr:dockerin type I repeat-containing protein [Candidatus Glassbacteria bacterium]
MAALFLPFFPGRELPAQSPPPQVDALLLGDLDGSGRVDIFDLLKMLKAVVTGQVGDERQRLTANADRSPDGRVDVFDLIRVQGLISGKRQPESIVLSHSVKKVWAVGDGEKIFRDDTSHFAADSNSIWDGDSIRLAGLFNEVLGFQVIVQADSRGADGVEIEVSPLVCDSTGNVIAPAGGIPYGPAGYLDLFSQHYIRVINPTNPNWYYGTSNSRAAAPKRMTGWIPDALVTPDALPGRGGFPLDVPPGLLQGFWVDIYLPRDTTLAAGSYTGMARILQQGYPVDSLPVRLELLPHYLPDTNHTWVWLYHDSVEMYYQNLPGEEVDRMLHYEAHRHRIDLVGGFRPHHSAFDSTQMAAYKPWLDGSAYTEAAGYQGPGQASGEWLFPIGMYGSVSGSVMDTEAKARQQSDLWVNWFTDNAPQVRYFWYLVDEPGNDQFDWIRERSGWIKNNPGPGKSLPLFITREYVMSLDPDIDIWAGYHGVNLRELFRLKREGKDHWFYNGARPRYGSVILEAEAVDFRMNAWAKYIYGVNVWFLWHGTHWIHNGQGPRPHTPQRVFTDPVTFISGPNTFGNGDGIVFYPGRDPYYPE